MWEYRLELLQPGKQVPRYSQLFRGDEGGHKEAVSWKSYNCEREGGIFVGKPQEFKNATDRGPGIGKADRPVWAVFYEEFRENDFGLEIP